MTDDCDDGLKFCNKRTLIPKLEINIRSPSINSRGEHRTSTVVTYLRARSALGLEVSPFQLRTAEKAVSARVAVESYVYTAMPP
jgi:hypothetical protein